MLRVGTFPVTAQMIYAKSFIHLTVKMLEHYPMDVARFTFIPDSAITCIEKCACPVPAACIKVRLKTLYDLFNPHDESLDYTPSSALHPRRLFRIRTPKPFLIPPSLRIVHS